jgi:hypothetical protein
MPWQFTLPKFADTADAIADRSHFWRNDQRLEVIMFQLCSAGIGVLLARIISSHLFPLADLKLRPLAKDSGAMVDIGLAWALASMLVGWQSFCGLAPLILLLWAMLRRYLVPFDRAGSILLATPVAITLVIFLWPWLIHLPYWPAPGHVTFLYLLYPTATWFIAWQLRDRRTEPEKPAHVDTLLEKASAEEPLDSDTPADAAT